MPSEFTYGVEEEYQLVDPASGALRSRAEEVLAIDWSGEIAGELQETQLEIATPVCTRASQVAEQLGRLRVQAGAAAATQELEIVAAGLHPFSRWKGHHLSEDGRPRMLEERFGRVIRDEHLFGMHVHVAVPDENARVEVLNRVSGYAPYLLALSASSPFYEGEDTGYASFRTLLNRRLPFSGAPPCFDSAEEYEAFMGFLLRTDAVPDRRTLYWSVRLSPRYPTVEFRVCDVCPHLDDAVGIAALARLLVVLAAREELPPLPPADSFRSGLVDLLRTQNEWRAARYGLEAHLLDPSAPSGERPLREGLCALLERVAPLARSLGDAEAVGHLGSLLERGNAADRLRERFGEAGGGRDAVSWLIAETRLGAGLDRRRSQREKEGA